MNFPHQEAGFCNDGLTTAERRHALGEEPARAGVIGIVLREQRDQRTGIEQDARWIHSPKPSNRLVLVERSLGPFLNRPTLRPATSSALRRRPSSFAIRRSPRRTISDSVRPVDCFSSSSTARSAPP